MSQLTRRGLPWLPEEIQQLLQEVKKKETHEEIASKHGRTAGAIRSRLRELAADYYFNDNRPMEDIIKFTGLDVETISDAIAKRQYTIDLQEKKEKSKSYIQTTLVSSNEARQESSITLLKEIRDIMREMLEILRKN